MAERQADNLIWFARTFRKAFGDRYQFGAYYGYPMEYGGSPMRMLFSGHLGAGRYIKNAPLDLISCPASYALRRTPDSHAFMNPADSCILRGKLPILENDVRNFIQPGNSDSSGSTIIGMRDSLENDLRLALLAHAHGAVVRYLALSDTVDWFAPLSSIANIARINRLGMEHRPAALGAPGQVAFAIDPDSLTGIADYPRDGRFQGEFISRGRDTVMRTGRSAAFLLLDDVLDHPGKWQYVAVPLPSLLDKDKLAKLEAQFGPLPKLTPDDGVLILRPEGNVTAGTREAFWKALATPEALDAGIKTVWYIGDNFRYTWDGKTLVKR